MERNHDKQKKIISISVRDLVGFVLRSGDLSIMFRGSARTTSLAGIRAHQKIQKSRPPNYDEEVPVSYLYQTESHDLFLQGRMDGVYEQDDKIVIEEIKTTNRELDLFCDDQNALHWGQLKTYAALYAIEHDLASVMTRLTYYRIEKAETKSFFKEFQTEELIAFLETIVKCYLTWIEKIEDWHTTRNSLIKASDFPFPSYRKGQEQLKEAMKRASSAVLFSATMTPLFYFSEILGCDESADKKTAPSPFPPENSIVKLRRGACPALEIPGAFLKTDD